jgi:hypothetical protein
MAIPGLCFARFELTEFSRKCLNVFTDRAVERCSQMLRTVSRLIATFILGLLLTTQTGCLIAAAAAGTGATVAYVRGDLEATLDADPKQVAEASERALKGMDVAVLSRETSSLDSKVTARTARDAKITIVAKAETSKVSHVSIRVGTFGDSAMQASILEKIQMELGQPTSASAE